MKIVEYGLYNIKDTYFEEFKDKYMIDNKKENRPFYFTFKDSDGVMWFIPLSSQTESYRKKIEKDEEKHRECIYYHIGVINGIERVFLIGNMFPVTDKYVKKAYTINGQPYVVANKNLIKNIHKKSTRFLTLVKKEIIRPNVDILKIKNELNLI